MEREKKLLKTSLILAIGNVFTKMITFFLLPLYTSILSTSEYGIVDLLNTLVLLLMPLVTLQLEQAVFRRLLDARSDENEQQKIITTGLSSISFQTLIYAMLFLIFSYFIDNDYKLFLFFNVVAYSYANVLQQIARGLEKNKQYTIACLISGIFTIVFNVILLVVFPLNVYGMLLGTLIGQIACILYLTFVLKLSKYIKKDKFDSKLLKKMFKYSLPLIPNQLSWWVFNTSDRVIVSTILGLSMNGILSAASKFSGLFIMVYNFYHLSWLESVSINLKDKDFKEFFQKMFNVSAKFFVFGVSIMISLMPFVYNLIINENFNSGLNQVPILMLAAMFNVLLALESSLYVAYKDTKAIANTSIIAAIINILVHCIFIKFIGLYAASLSTLASYLVLYLHRHFDIKNKYLSIKYDKDLILFMIVTFPLNFVCYYSNNFVLLMINLVLTFIFGIVLNKKMLNSFFNNIIRKKV